MVIDQERCIGCEACVVACKIENGPTAEPWISVDTVVGNQGDIPVGEYPNLRLDFLPRLCMHCARPPCLEVCSSQALWRREDGLVILDNKKCDGCLACVEACPYRIIIYSPKTGLVEKCDLCAHRIDRGLEPFCVICCEGQAMNFGDLNDPASEVSRLIASRDTFSLMPELGTSPSVYYCRLKERRPL